MARAADRLSDRNLDFRLFLGETLQEPLPSAVVFDQIDLPPEDLQVFAADEFFQTLHRDRGAPAQVGGLRSRLASQNAAGDLIGSIPIVAVWTR
ncbi:hypothetical protein [Bradyrhizobium sp. UNPF46]|uniref:hypothetical protein n=1 Tax=Bradyrhizobium sp. UNPF46 TaxID=1141168 RepID=UPI00114F86E9|nr:hypothetical protein [Bradyrhizobium sp. UNPF46]